MKTITLELPDDTSLDEEKARRILIAKLFELGELSSGQAADMIGISKRAFIETLGTYGASIFNITPGELQQDLMNAAHYRI